MPIFAPIQVFRLRRPSCHWDSFVGPGHKQCMRRLQIPQTVCYGVLASTANRIDCVAARCSWKRGSPHPIIYSRCYNSNPMSNCLHGMLLVRISRCGAMHSLCGSDCACTLGKIFWDSGGRLVLSGAVLGVSSRGVLLLVSWCSPRNLLLFVLS